MAEAILVHLTLRGLFLANQKSLIFVQYSSTDLFSGYGSRSSNKEKRADFTILDHWKVHFWQIKKALFMYNILQPTLGLRIRIYKHTHPALCKLYLPLKSNKAFYNYFRRLQSMSNEGDPHTKTARYGRRQECLLIWNENLSKTGSRSSVFFQLIRILNRNPQLIHINHFFLSFLTVFLYLISSLHFPLIFLFCSPFESRDISPWN